MVVDKEQFRQFERFNIEYDIAIDEEEWRNGCDNIEGIDLDRCFEITPQGKVIFQPPDVAGLRIIPDQFDINEFSLAANSLMVTKRIRAYVQESNDSRKTGCLDEIALTLLKAIPADIVRVDTEQFGESEYAFLMRIILLNEVAACYRGMASIGYADLCLDLIKDKIQRNHTPYELVALYNKAQGYLHIREHQKAYQEFRKISYNGECAYWGDSHWYQWPQEDRTLFNHYVVNLATIMQADTLVNLQRCEEADEVLKVPEEPSINNLPEYQLKRVEILRRKIKLDKTDEKGLNQINDNLDWLNGENKANLATQKRSILIELHTRRLAKLGRELKREEYQPKIRELVRLIVTLIEQQLAQNRLNVYELDDALNLWAQSLKTLISLDDIDVDAIRGILLMSFELPGRESTQLVEIIFERICDGIYHSHMDETREVIVDSLKMLVLKQIDDAELSSDVREKLRRLLRSMLEANERTEDKLMPPLMNYQSSDYDRWIALADDAPAVGRDTKGLNSFLAREYFSQKPFQKGHKVRKGLCPKGDDCRHSPASDLKSYYCPECNQFKARLKTNPEVTVFEREDRQYEHYYDSLIELNRKRNNQRLYVRNSKWGTPSGWGFVVLQKWNSYTPALALSEGGGYFLYHSDRQGKIDLGIVIDPGYGFLKNFLYAGFGICDITDIVISHNHPDHIQDFYGILNLILETNKNRFALPTIEQYVRLYLSEGSFKYLEKVIESSRDNIQDTVVLEPKQEKEYQIGPSHQLKLRPTTAIHPDTIEEDSLGFIFSIENSASGEKSNIGLTCDTRWDERYMNNYIDCDVLCVHLGSITPDSSPDNFLLQQYYDDSEVLKKVLAQKWQLYLPGVYQLCNLISNDTIKTVILSEFGEELIGGLRVNFAERIESHFRGSLKVFAGDVGLFMDPISKSIKCSFCESFHGVQHYLKSYIHNRGKQTERIFYCCPICETKLTDTEKRDRINELMEPWIFSS